VAIQALSHEWACRIGAKRDHAELQATRIAGGVTKLPFDRLNYGAAT
jgi:hypothetical protein